jgi:uncharacterized protein (UPF0335 family)
MSIKEHAAQLSETMQQIADLKEQEKAILESAKDAGLNVKALRKVAKEMITDSAKLSKVYADEDQLDMFRHEVGIFAQKGLMETDKAANAGRINGERRLVKAAKELDALVGSDLAGSYEADRRKVNKFIARQAD